MRCFLLLVQAVLFSIVSSSLTCPVFVSSAAVDRWITASWLVQQSSWHPCSGSPCAALPAKQLTSQQLLQPPVSCKTSVWKVKSKSCSWKNSQWSVLLYSRSLNQNTGFKKPAPRTAAHFSGLWASPCAEGCAVQREALSMASAGAGMQSGRRHILLAQGALCLILCLTAQLFCVHSVNAHSRQKPAAVSFEVSAGGTMEEKQVSCSPLSSEAGKSLNLNAPWLLFSGSSLKSVRVKTPVIPEVIVGSALAPH